MDIYIYRFIYLFKIYMFYNLGGWDPDDPDLPRAVLSVVSFMYYL